MKQHGKKRIQKKVAEGFILSATFAYLFKGNVFVSTGISFPNFDAVRSVETKLKMAAAKAQYGRDNEAARMIEEASELVEQYNDKLIQALGEDEYEQLVKILDIMVRPMPVDGKILLRLITKALAIIKNGYKTDDKIEFGGI